MRSDIKRTADGEAAAIQDMSIDHGSLHIFMSEEFLNSSDIVATLQQVGGKAVAERVTANRLVHACATSGFFHCSPYRSFAMS